MSNEPKDTSLYEAIKKRVYAKNPEHSAYRSGTLTKEYKKAYQAKHCPPGSACHCKGTKSDCPQSAYTGTKPKDSGISRWFREKWSTQTGSSTYQKKGDIFRPTVRVNAKTPTTMSELSEKQIKKASAEKASTGRVKKYDI